MGSFARPSPIAPHAVLPPAEKRVQFPPPIARADLERAARRMAPDIRFLAARGYPLPRTGVNTAPLCKTSPQLNPFSPCPSSALP